MQTRPGLKTLPEWISVRKRPSGEAVILTTPCPDSYAGVWTHSASASLKGWGELRPSFIASALRTSIGKIAQGLRVSHLCRLFSWNHLDIIFSWNCFFSARSHVCVCVSKCMCAFLYVVKWSSLTRNLFSVLSGEMNNWIQFLFLDLYNALSVWTLVSTDKSIWLLFMNVIIYTMNIPCAPFMSQQCTGILENGWKSTITMW